MNLPRPRSTRATIHAALGALCAAVFHAPVAAVPVVLDTNLTVNTVVSGLSQPTGMAFIGPGDIFVTEKATGRVQRVVNGAVQGTVLDLAVNSASERGLLGIALEPNFATTHGVYLYWTQSATGGDSTVLDQTPLLGNRVDRFVWNGSTLTFDRNLIQLRALQPASATEPIPAAGRGNNNGGVLRFGPDGNLYVFVGDVGRRGQLQNLPNGPSGPGLPDDVFGGPEPDNAHLTGGILRLTSTGGTPADNPFFAAGAQIGGAAGANIQKLYSYGQRNSFGMAFDPLTGKLWTTENGDDAYDEINQVQPGMNGGWVQIMGPVSRVADYKAIETTTGLQNLQQLRWPPSNIADTPADAQAALFELPGSQYSDPEFSWRFNIAPAALGFQSGNALGSQYNGNMFVGAATAATSVNPNGGYLLRFVLDGPRDGVSVSAPGLSDLVADNVAKFDFTESESLLFGTGFGIATDIQTGPNGNLFVVSLSDGAIYEIAAIAGTVPEPATLALLGIGIAGLARGRRRHVTFS